MPPTSSNTRRRTALERQCPLRKLSALQLLLGKLDNHNRPNEGPSLILAEVTAPKPSVDELPLNTGGRALRPRLSEAKPGTNNAWSMPETPSRTNPETPTSTYAMAGHRKRSAMTKLRRHIAADNSQTRGYVHRGTGQHERRLNRARNVPRQCRE